jgi:hypothetical protein
MVKSSDDKEAKNVRGRDESSAGTSQLVMLAVVALILIVLVLILLTLTNQIFPPWAAYLD